MKRGKGRARQEARGTSSRALTSHHLKRRPDARDRQLRIGSSHETLGIDVNQTESRRSHRGDGAVAVDGDVDALLVVAAGALAAAWGEFLCEVRSCELAVMDGWMGRGGDDGCNGLGCAGMGWDGMGWDGMGWDGMGWDGMRHRPAAPALDRARCSPFRPLRRRAPRKSRARDRPSTRSRCCRRGRRDRQSSDRCHTWT